MMTTFIASTLLAHNVGYWWAFAIVLVIGFGIGSASERILIRPLHGKSELNPVIVTIGLLVVARRVGGRHYGNASRGFPAAFSQSGLKFGNTRIAFSHFDVFILIAVLVVMLATLALFRFTALGLKMRASAFPGKSLRLLGVRVGRLLTLAGAWPASPAHWPDCWWPRRGSLRSVLHGFVPCVRIHRGGDRWTRESGGRAHRRPGDGLSVSYVGGYLGSGFEPMGALVC